MAHPDDPREDAPTEWLSPALYRQLCDAVDSALTLPAESRESVLAARLGNDPRLLAEARALLASYEASPHTVVTTTPGPAGGPSSGTAIIRGVGPGPDADGTQQVPVGGWERPPDLSGPSRPSSGTVALPAHPLESAGPAHGGPDAPPHSGSRAAALPWEDTPVVVPRVGTPSGGTVATIIPPRDHAWEPEPLPAAYPPPEPVRAAAPQPPIPAAPVSAPPAPPLPPPTPPIAAPVAAAPPAPVPDVRAIPERPAASGHAGAGVPVRPTGGGRSLGTALGAVVLVVLAFALAGAIWFWLAADRGRRDAEANVALATERLALSERRFDVVRQLGTRLAEVDNLLAVTDDGGARAARAVLVRTWLQYLQDLQRASGGTDRELLLEISRGYKQVAATQGGSGRTLGDLAGAAKTLQIGIRLLEYLDRTARQPDPAILRELTASQVALGDVLLGGKDGAASTEQYRKALATAERLGSIGGNEADAQREVAAIRQRLQAAPPPPAP